MAEEPTGLRARRKVRRRAGEEAERKAQERGRVGLTSLKEWVRLVFGRAAAIAESLPLPPATSSLDDLVSTRSTRYRPRVNANDKQWADLASHEMLDAWIRAAAAV